jgi:hypothetical protein
MRSLIAGQSTLVTAALMPNSGARRTPAATSAVYTSILLGIQPWLMQVPPKAPASMTATGPQDRSSGTMTFPDPEPTMASEKCCT